MKIYKNKDFGFEIDIPEDWSLHKDRVVLLWNFLVRLMRGWTPRLIVAFTCGPNEILNLVVEPMRPEPSPEITQRLFVYSVQDKGYSNLEFGRISIGGRDHTWVRYLMSNRVWSKKYMIILGGNGYAITASCTDQGMFPKREKIWDEIASSLRLLSPINDK